MISINLNNEIKKITTELKLKKGSTLYIAGNLYNFGLKKTELEDFCNYFLEYLIKYIGNGGNITVPTATLNLINSNKIFEKKKTKSYCMGIFSEFIRKKKNSYRSDHPLFSFYGIGKNVKKILGNTSVSAYGEGSVFQKLRNNNTYFISLGKPHAAIGMIHYVEQLIGVPYRFNKEVFVRVKKNNKIKKQYSLVGVRFISKNIVKGNGNKKIISKLVSMNTFRILKFKKSVIYICKYDKIINNLISILQNNPRIWLKDTKRKQATYYIN